MTSNIGKEQMTVRVRNSYSKITENDIDLLNSELEITVPDQYRDFLLKNNGGQPENNLFKTNGFDFYVITLYGIGMKGQTGKDLVTMFAASCEVVPEELLPIGDDGVGNIICLGIKGKEYYGKIYIWWKDDQVDEGEAPLFDNVDLLAGSFNEFLALLKKEN